jgi:hypothetical protein
MSHLILPGGTDIAEVGLFSTDALPLDRGPTPDALSELQRSGQMLRMPTGADGGYLLHAYVDESIPSEVLRCCSEDDRLVGEFRTTSGNIAFGGLESAFRNFKENHSIRTDATITPGTYRYTAYHTQYSDEVVSADINSSLSKGELRFLAIPGPAGIVTVLAVAIAGTSHHFVFAAVVAALGAIIIRMVVRSTQYKSLRSRKKERELRYPSIVIELRSAAT